MVSLKKTIKLIIATSLILFLMVSISFAEEMLIQGTAKYIGWQTGLNEFTTCDKNIIPIGNGQIKPTDKQCRSQDGISPIANKSINGKIVKINKNTNKITLKDIESGKLSTLYYPHLSKKLNIGSYVWVTVPIEGRAELLKVHRKKGDFKKELDVGAMLMASFELMNKGKFDKAQKMLDKVLSKDPGNPLALNNMAAIMVKQNKFDKADTYLNQALVKAKGYMVQVNRVCQVRGICVAFKPASGGTGNQELESLIKLNLEMVKQYMASEPLSGRGPR